MPDTRDLERRFNQMKGWADRLGKLQVEMEKENDPIPRGMNPPDWEALTRLAWQECYRERKLLAERLGVRDDA